MDPEKFHTTPNALHLAKVVSTGDTIEMDGGLYQEQATLAVWKANQLFIRWIAKKEA